ncbi:MAG TPA: 4Fe-4S dicluster domain-containing protein [Lacunisphaera sp.]|nr:4Fe-4S dicluster domain-containing protein [Lacunisphaera sp.]
MSLAVQVQQAGVVGAGGGGFPAHVKLAARADTVIANGAECEPLLHKDGVVMEHLAAALVRGVELSMGAVGATTGVIAIKAKNHHAVEAVQGALAGSRVQLKLLGDYYPAGDEYDLVYEVTGRLIPPAGLPIQVGVVVNNVETIVNIAAAAAGRPVTLKYLTVAGAVRAPATVVAPLGTSLADCIAACGGATVEDPVLCIGGMMMGETTDQLDTPVTKTTTGVIVLPRGHTIVQRKLQPPAAQARIGKSACDQCRYCTEYCPRFLLGYAVEPHQVMRGLGFNGSAQGARWDDWAALCCSCGLCTLYSCPELLFPKEACDDAKAALRAASRKWTGPANVRPHPMREGRRVPIKALLRKLRLQEYDRPAPLQAQPLAPARLVLRLKQSAGTPARPVVRAGDRLAADQLVAEPAPDALGARLHAPFPATVETITATEIHLKRLL